MGSRECWLEYITLGQQPLSRSRRLRFELSTYGMCKTRRMGPGERWLKYLTLGQQQAVHLTLGQRSQQAVHVGAGAAFCCKHAVLCVVKARHVHEHALKS